MQSQSNVPVDPTRSLKFWAWLVLKSIIIVAIIEGNRTFPTH